MRETAHDASDDTAGDAVSFSHYEPMKITGEHTNSAGNTAYDCVLVKEELVAIRELLIDSKKRLPSTKVAGILQLRGRITNIIRVISKEFGL